MKKAMIPKRVATAIETIREAGMAEHALYDRKWLESEVDDTKKIREAKDAILDFIGFGSRFDPHNGLVTYYNAVVNDYEILPEAETESGKVTVSAEIAEAIRAAKACGHGARSIMELAMQQEDASEHRNALRDFANRDFVSFMKAIANGFEVGA